MYTRATTSSIRFTNHTAATLFAAIAAIFAGLLLATPAQAGITSSQIAKLLAFDGAAGDQFGYSVAISGNTAIVGAFLDSVSAGVDPGSAYIFVRDAAGVWTQQAKLLSSDGAAKDQFGFTVAISGETALVGAKNHNDIGTNSGSAYIFVRDAAGVWTQNAKLFPSDGAAGDRFGASVAISGDTAVVGAQIDGDNGIASGSAYVFVRSAPGTWTQESKLLPLDGATGDWFGISAAVNGDTAIIGAQHDNDNGTNSGSAYVFVRDAAGVWTQQVKLLPAGGATNDGFGSSVAISGASAIVGAHGNDENGPSSGSAYIFVRDAAGAWTQQANLLPPDGESGDQYGLSVAVSGDTAIVGARRDDDSGVDAGTVYVFTRDAAGLWTLKSKVNASDATSGDNFGHSVALDGDTAVIGAKLDRDNGPTSGSTYIFDFPPLPVGSSADLNGDGVVNAADLAQLLANWAP